MAKSLLREVLKSVTKTSITSVMLVVSVVRIGMLIYPVDPMSGQRVYYDYSHPAPLNMPASLEKRPSNSIPRIVTGQHSIENLR